MNDDWIAQVEATPWIHGDQDGEATDTNVLEGTAAYTGKDSTPKKKGNISKVVQLFEEVPYLKNALATNNFDQRIYVRNVVPWSTDKTNRPFDKELDFANIRQLVQNMIGTVDKESINNAISIIGNRIHFDSVIDELNLLPVWDGKKRVGHLLHWILGAEDTPYVSNVETILFNGLVMRQFQPGCKFDYIPVLIGAQDLGKSSFAEKLALNEEYFTDTPIDPKDKEVGRYVRGRIVVEIPELSGFKGKDIESIKAFVTRKYDDFRKLYVDDVIKHPRRYVLIGTTNEDHFLKDKTGNRRFLPVYCGICVPTIPIEEEQAVTLEIRQAWAETLERYRNSNNKLPLVLSKETKAEAKQTQDQAMQDDPQIGLIGAWLHDRELFYPDDRICALQIIYEALGKEKNKYETYLPETIHKIIKENFPQWKYVNQRLTVKGYGQQRHYVLEKNYASKQ